MRPCIDPLKVPSKDTPRAIFWHRLVVTLCRLSWLKTLCILVTPNWGAEDEAVTSLHIFDSDAAALVYQYKP